MRWPAPRGRGPRHADGPDRAERMIDRVLHELVHDDRERRRELAGHITDVALHVEPGVGPVVRRDGLPDDPCTNGFTMSRKGTTSPTSSRQRRGHDRDRADAPLRPPPSPPGPRVTSDAVPAAGAARRWSAGCSSRGDDLADRGVLRHEDRTTVAEVGDVADAATIAPTGVARCRAAADTRSSIDTSPLLDLLRRPVGVGASPARAAVSSNPIVAELAGSARRCGCPSGAVS